MPPGTVVSLTVAVHNLYASSSVTVTLTKAIDERPVATIQAAGTVTVTDNAPTIVLGAVSAGPCLAAAANLTVTVAYLATTPNFPATRLASSAAAAALPDPAVWNPDGLPLLDQGGVKNPRNFRTNGLPSGTYGLRMCGIACWAGPGSGSTPRTCTASCDQLSLVVTRGPVLLRVNGADSLSTVTVPAAAPTLTVTVTDTSAFPLGVDTAPHTDEWSCSPGCAVEPPATPQDDTFTLTGVPAGTTAAVTVTRTFPSLGIVAVFDGSVRVVTGVALDVAVAWPPLGPEALASPAAPVTVTAVVLGEVEALLWSCPACPAALQRSLSQLQSSFEAGTGAAAPDAGAPPGFVLAKKGVEGVGSVHFLTVVGTVPQGAQLTFVASVRSLNADGAAVVTQVRAGRAAACALVR